MEVNFKRILMEFALAIVAVVVIGTFGVTALDGNEAGNRIKYKTAAEVKEIIDKARGENDFNMLSNFKKAGIEEYDMTVQSELVNRQSAKVINAGEFVANLPGDNTSFQNPQPTALNYYATRNVAEEYYTVYDIISGSTVTMNGYELLCQIVNSEIGATWNEEAIKAQIVAAYSYLRFNDSIGLIATVGLNPDYPAKIQNCVNAVQGQCVFYNGSIINAVYSASSAGYSTESENVWGVYYPYLRAVVSEFDNEDPNYGVVVKYTQDEVKSIIEANTDIALSDNVQNWFKVDTMFSEKYVGKMTIDGRERCIYNGANVRINGDMMRKMFGLKSNAFTISYKDGVFTITTYGYGHGVGMSQWGACLYANRGYTYDQILRHYYVDTTISVSNLNQKAVNRAHMSQGELSKEIDGAKVIDNTDLNAGNETDGTGSNQVALEQSNNQWANETAADYNTAQ